MNNSRLFIVLLLAIIALLVYIAFIKVDPGEAALGEKYEQAYKDSVRVWDKQASQHIQDALRAERAARVAIAKADSLDSLAKAVIIRSNELILNMAENKTLAKQYGESIRNKSDSEQVQIFLERAKK